MKSEVYRDESKTSVSEALKELFSDVARGRARGNGALIAKQLVCALCSWMEQPGNWNRERD